MLDLIIGKPKDEALKLADTFMNMIKGTAAPEQIETLDEAGSLADIAHMPARVKCAVLGWHTMQDMIQHDKEHGHSNEESSTLAGSGTAPHCEK
jgi:nitrogen fixation NifU-like protein